MGQIVKRKKKGRPPKSDLAKRSPKSAPPQTPEPDLRRSLRRRSVRYNFIDYDDYIDDDYDFYDDRAGGGGGGEEEGDDEEEDEDERRRGKKLKLVVKLDQKARGEHARDSGASGSDEEESEKRAVKKRRISGGRSGDEDAEELERGGDDAEDDDEELRGLRGNTTELNSPTARSSTPLSSSGIPLPDKRTLELILDKLQKKDIYGVYAEPVDPEELPDYHDIIEHPMDFSTVRKKLANGSYSTLEQFESDVFLICSNAMQYNAPDTIYHKQAHSIQELGRKKFLKLRIAFERLEKENKAEDKVKMDLEQSERELKSEQRAKPSFLVKKQMKKQFSRPLQEPVCSDSAGLTCGDVGDVPNCSAANHAVGYDVPSNVEGLTESNASQVENNIDKAEDFSLGKTLPSKFGRKPYVIDENRRATYNITEQPVVESETIFSTFEGEVRQLVAVGLTVEYSYARSLARFAATLGPAAWKLASQKIERALPAGCKFGRGWVGEYEPQPTSVFTFRNHTKKDYPLVARLPYKDGLRKNDVISKTSVPVKEHTVTRPSLEGKPFSSSNGKPPVHAGRRSNTTNNVNYQMQSPRSRISSEPKSKVVEQLELNSLPSGCQNNVEHAPEKNLPKNTEAAGFRSVESVLRNHNTEASVAASSGREQVVRDISQLQPLPSEQPDATGVISGGLSNGKVSITCLENGGTNPTSTSSAIPNQMPRIISNSYGQDQGLSDPVQLMRMLAEKAQWQHNSSNHSVIDATSVVTPTPSSKRDDPGNAAAAAARAWMSVGAGGLKQAMENSRVHNSQLPANFPYNPSYEFLSHMARIQGELPASVIMQFQSQKNSLPGQMSGRPPFQGGTEVQYQNRPVVFPQFIAANMARFQPQSPWRGVSTHALPRQKQETRPPDLNIGFQPPGSPVPQSSGVMVDTQQPDLALQL